MRDSRCVFGSNLGFNSSYSISFKASYRFCTLNVVIISFVSELWEREFWKAGTGVLTGNPGTLKAVFLEMITLVTVPRHPSQGPRSWVLRICICTRVPGSFYHHWKLWGPCSEGPCGPQAPRSPGYVDTLCCVFICAFLWGIKGVCGPGKA